jgi:hypothetical protein
VNPISKIGRYELCDRLAKAEAKISELEGRLHELQRAISIEPQVMPGNVWYAAPIARALAASIAP